MNYLLRLGSAGIEANWPIIFRGLLYFSAGYIPAFTEAIAEFLKKDQWPSGPRLFYGFLMGSFAGVVIIRAYLDGSPQRHADVVEERKRTGTTAFFNKPAP